MDMNQLRMLVAVEDTGSITAAADLLGVTQPVVSRAIHRLQSDLDATLVVPRGRGIELTAEGRRVAAEARSLVAAFDALAASRPAPAAATPLRIASYEPWSTWFVPEALAAAGIERADVVELVPGELELALADSRIDLAITAHPAPRPGVAYERVARVRTVECVADRVADGSSLPWVAPFDGSTGTIDARSGLDGWPDARRRDVAFRVTMLETALALCRTGAARALLPAPLVERHNAAARSRDRIRSRALRPALPQLDVLLAHRTDSPLDSRSLDLLGALRAMLRTG